MRKILFISGSIGLGHISRDLSITRKLRKANPEIEISWLASRPASLVINESGEKLLHEADDYANDTVLPLEIFISAQNPSRVVVDKKRLIA